MHDKVIFLDICKVLKHFCPTVTLLSYIFGFYAHALLFLGVTVI